VFNKPCPAPFLKKKGLINNFFPGGSVAGIDCKIRDEAQQNSQKKVKLANHSAWSLPNSPGKKLLTGLFFSFKNGAGQGLLNTL
jgi:hypothetical protein